MSDNSQPQNKLPYDEKELNAAFMEWADKLAKGHAKGLGSGSSNQDIGKALRTIRDKRLHREVHSNFYVYCAGRFGLMPNRVDFFISVADLPAPAPRSLVQPTPQSIVSISPEEAMETPCVYFVEAGGMVKIGYTKDLRVRMSALQTGSPIKLTLLKTIPGDKRKEAELHMRFAEDRQHGEWFTFSEALKAFLETLS